MSLNNYFSNTKLSISILSTVVILAEEISISELLLFNYLNCAEEISEIAAVKLTELTSSKINSSAEVV